MSEKSLTNYRLASYDFRRARSAAGLEQVLARLRGVSSDLLSYEEVAQKLHALQTTPRGLQDIPLNAIIGSVGRYTDFTRTFLPKHDSNQDRWSRVMVATNSLKGLPPIEVYQVGEAYFVKDGNHRVSVARQLGAKSIEAYVIEVEAKVAITPDINIDDLILKSEYIEFLEKTRLDELRPEVDLTLTAPGKYAILLEHIAVHRYFMGLDMQRDISYEEAVGHWYDAVYQPIADLIRQRGLLHDFPDRTNADLYLWIMEHRSDLEKALGWQIELDEAADQLASDHGRRALPLLSRVGGRILDAVLPDSLENGSRPGAWREEREAHSRNDRLFRHILVPISDESDCWPAVDMALEIARREDGRLRGLHVVPNEEHHKSDAALAVRAQFDQRCREAGVPGNLVIETGAIAHIVTERSNWADLVVAKLNYPPKPGPLATLSSDFGTLVRRSTRPILGVPYEALIPTRALLAYDGSPKAREALYVAAYLACAWGLELDVLVVGGVEAEPIMCEAHNYLDLRQVEAQYRIESGPVAESILGIAAERDHRLILMGGYGHSPVIEAILGSALNQVLRESDRPVLVCR